MEPLTHAEAAESYIEGAQEDLLEHNPERAAVIESLANAHALLAIQEQISHLADIIKTT